MRVFPALSGILDPIVKVAQNGFVVGGAIGAAIAVGLGAKALTLCAAVVVGAIGYTSGAGGAGPVGAYIAAVIGIEIGRLVEGKTKVDILLVPIAVLLTGGVVGVLLGAPLGAFMKWLGYIIGKATYLNPIPMGIIVSVVMGIILTAPISSAAIASMIFVTANAAPDVKTGLMLGSGCRNDRLLMPDGRFCCFKLPRKPLGRHCFSGTRHINASGAEYIASSCNPCSADACKRDPRTVRNNGVPNAERGHFGRHGYLRICGSDRNIYDNASKRQRVVVDTASRAAAAYCCSRCAFSAFQRNNAQARVDKTERYAA